MVNPVLLPYNGKSWLNMDVHTIWSVKENNLTHGWPSLFSQQSTKVGPGGKQTLLCNVKQSYTGLLC